MNLKTRLKAFAALLFVAGAAFGEDQAAAVPGDLWRTDFEAALTTAKDEGKAVLLDFTGSDWCVWCHRLEAEVFEQQAFLDYAREHLVLVRLDFPRKTKLPTELQAQNDALSERFDVGGYPTVILLDASGEEIGRLGYTQGGAKTFVRALKKFRAEATASREES
ncbi:MAG TPA: thioredoxin family protein [Opitutaceae bacterium]|nr:thioredoxin family protein [Opitutaceae bacterium]